MNNTGSHPNEIKRDIPIGVSQYLSIQVSLVRNCLENSTMRNPVHTSETRMCGDENLYTLTAWMAVHRQLGTAFQAD